MVLGVLTTGIAQLVFAAGPEEAAMTLIGTTPATKGITDTVCDPLGALRHKSSTVVRWSEAPDKCRTGHLVRGST